MRLWRLSFGCCCSTFESVDRSVCFKATGADEAIGAGNDRWPDSLPLSRLLVMLGAGLAESSSSSFCLIILRVLSGLSGILLLAAIGVLFNQKLFLKVIFNKLPRVSVLCVALDVVLLLLLLLLLLPVSFPIENFLTSLFFIIIVIFSSSANRSRPGANRFELQTN